MPTLQAARGLAQALQSQARIVPYAAIVPRPAVAEGGQQRIQMRDVLVDRADEAVAR